MTPDDRFADIYSHGWRPATTREEWQAKAAVWSDCGRAIYADAVGNLRSPSGQYAGFREYYETELKACRLNQEDSAYMYAKARG